MKLVVGLVAGSVAVSLVIAANGFADALDEMQHMRVGFLLLALALTTLRLLLYGLQLIWLGRRSGGLAARTGIALAMIVYGFGAVTPASPAEGLTLASHDLRRRGRTKRQSRLTLGISEWFTQRTFYAVAAIDLIVVAAFGHLSVDESWPTVVVASFVLLALFGTALLARKPQSAEWIVRLLSALRIRRPDPNVPPRQAAATWHAEAIAVLGSSRNRARLALVSAFAVLADSATLWATCQAAGVSLPFDLILLAATVGTMASWVPILPSGLGLVEATIPAVLHRFGAPLDGALAATLVHRAIAVLLPALVGALVLTALRVDRQRKHIPLGV